MNTCEACGHQSPDWAEHCTACGAEIRARGSDADAECGHLEYLLARIPEWRAQGIIPPGSATRLTNAARRRIAELRSSAQQPSAPPVYPVETPVAAPDAPSVADDRAPSDRQGARPGPSVAEFFETHWLKLLAVVAAAFILAGVRQVMGVAWIERLALLLVPIMPLALSAGLIRWVVRSGAPDSVAARACGGTGVILAAFAAAAVNRHWLGGFIVPTWTLLIAAIVGACTAAGVARRTADRTYLHYVLGFGALAGPAGVLAIAGASRLGEALPWHVAAGLAVMGIAYLGLGVLPTAGDGDTTLIHRAPLTAWGTAATSAAIAAAAVQMALADAFLPMCLAILIACAAAAGVAAWLSRSGTLAGSSAAALTLAGLVFVPDRAGADALTWGYLAAALGAIWAGPVLLLRANRTADMNPASAIFGRCSAAAYGIAGILTSLHALSCVGNAVSISGPGWERLAVLSGICTAAYAFAAWITRRPTVMYAASGGAALTFGVLASAWLRTTTFQPLHHAGHDLALASLALLAIGASVARRSTVDRTADQHENTAPDWSAPWLSSGALLAALAIVVALAWTSTRGVDAGTWVAIVAATAGSSIAFAGVLRYTERTTAQALLTASLAGCVALMGLAGNATPFAVGTAAALMASAWLFAVAAFPMRHRADSLWITPLRGMAVIAYVAASGALSARYPGMADRYLAQTPYLVHSGYVLAAAAIGFACIGAFRREHEPTATALAAVSLLHCWLLHGIHPTAAISAQCAVASAACSVAFGLRASREIAATPWLSAIAGALAWYGVVRWIGGPLQDWTALAMLPGIAGLYALSECAALPYELRFAARWIAVATFIVSAVSSEASGLVLGFPHSRLALTMGAYTVAAAVAATRRASVNWTVTASACWSLTAAHGAAWFDLPDAVWAFAFVACAIPYPVTVFFMGRAERWSPVRSFVGAVAATHLAIGILAALEAATATDLGSVSVVAIALAGLLLASLFTVGLGAPYAHASAACFMVANAMIVYDRVSISAGVLDLYLIPVGAYLLVLGHLADRRVRADEAKGLWWTGALVVMTPTFIAFWTNFSEGGPLGHALLLVAECLAAVLWGIANRIRAFVITGGAYALAFAAVLGAASVQEIWIGLVALVVGLGLLAVVVQLNTRAEATRAWIDRTVQEWRRWR